MVFIFRYQLIGSVKKNLSDNLAVKVNLIKRNDLKLVVRSEDSTLLNVLFKSDKFKIPRVYGKNLFYLKLPDTIRYLDVSYYKYNVWRRSDIHLDVREEGDSLHIFWERNYANSKVSGNQAIFLNNN